MPKPSRPNALSLVGIALGSILVVFLCLPVLSRGRSHGPVTGQWLCVALLACLMVINFVNGLRAGNRSRWLAYLAATICLLAVWATVIETLARHIYRSV